MDVFFKIAYSHYKNGFTEEGFPTHEIIIDIEARLRTLGDLYDQGLISGEEYEAKRKKILDSL